MPFRLPLYTKRNARGRGFLPLFGVASFSAENALILLADARPEDPGERANRLFDPRHYLFLPRGCVTKYLASL